jgi:hypothetical protein
MSRLLEGGLTAVDAERSLQANRFEAEMTEVFERNAATLFFAGYGPRLICHRPCGWVGEEEAVGARGGLPEPRQDVLQMSL